MFYFDKLKTKKRKSDEVFYDAFYENSNVDKLPKLSQKEHTRLCYNFCTQTGELITGYGFSDLVLPIDINDETTRTVWFSDVQRKNLWFFKSYNATSGKFSYKILCDNQNGNLEMLNVFSPGIFTTEILLESPFQNSPTGICYTVNNEDYILFSGEEGLYKFTEGEVVKHNAVLPKFVDLCYGYENLFGIVEGKRSYVFYSLTLDPMQWTVDENVIELTDERGKCNSLIYFNDYLYVFRDYGITKISKYSTRGEFSVYNLFTSGNKIYGKTVVKCEDDVFFFTRDGLYKFNGSSTDKINLNINALFKNINNENAVACFSENQYILACKLNFNDEQKIGCENHEDGFVNNAIIFYDIHKNTFNILRGVDVHSLLALNQENVSTVLATFNKEYKNKIGMLNKNGEFFGNFLNAEWGSVKTDLGHLELIKNIKEIYIKSQEDCNIKIQTNLEEKEVKIKGKNKLQKIKTFVKGNEFCVKVCANNQSRISPFKLKIEVVKNEV